MRASRHGIDLTRQELTALNAFTSEAANFNVVHFRITSSGKLHVCASDGKRAVEVVAEAEQALEGEWHITREFIEQCRRATDNGETQIRLVVTEKGLKHAIVVAIQDGEERATIADKKASTSTQLSMTKVLELARCTRRLTGGSYYAMHPDHQDVLSKVSAAVEKCPLSYYPPADPNGYLSFEASGGGGRWGGVISTTPVVGPGDAAVPEKEIDQTPPGKERPLKLEPTLATSKRAKKPKATKGGKKPRSSGKGAAATNGAHAKSEPHDTEPPGKGDDGIVDDDYVKRAARGVAGEENASA